MGTAAGENSVVCKNFTVASLDMVKVSNRKVRPEQQQKHQGPHGDSKKNPGSTHAIDLSSKSIFVLSLRPP
jgi:6-phosphogluconolactonase (cycloisomerase 2 family)